MTRLAWLLHPDHALEIDEELKKLAKSENPNMGEVIRRFAPRHWYQGKDGSSWEGIIGEDVIRVLDGICGDGKCLPTATLRQAIEMAESYGARLRRAAENNRNFDKFVAHIMPEMKNRHPLQTDDQLHYLARTEARRRVGEVDVRFRD